jgi:uncharacterized membrane protein/nitrite reductase/ring-hydroxylating ferredoxin subunit
MRSKIHLSGHPLHPILVAFPIAFFSGTFLFDLLGMVFKIPALWQTGMYLELAGCGFAVLAAVPGIVDYFSIVPPKSSAKARATKHGLINVIVLLIFVFTWFYRRGISANPAIVISAEAAGVILLSIAGWLGGTLVHRNQIGIDHRYAFAGKWSEEKISTEKKEIIIDKFADLKPGQMRLLHVNGKRIVLGNTEDGFVAFDDFCTHRGGSLADGTLICGIVQCPWHGSQFDTGSGSVKAGPARKSINIYTVSKSNGKLIISL